MYGYLFHPTHGFNCNLIFHQNIHGRNIPIPTVRYFHCLTFRCASLNFLPRKVQDYSPTGRPCKLDEAVFALFKLSSVKSTTWLTSSIGAFTLFCISRKKQVAPSNQTPTLCVFSYTYLNIFKLSKIAQRDYLHGISYNHVLLYRNHV